MNTRIKADPDSATLILGGSLTLADLREAETALDKAVQKLSDHFTVDASALEKLDSAGALLLRRLEQKRQVRYALKPEHRDLMSLLMEAKLEPPPRKKKPPAIKTALERLGKHAADGWVFTREMVAFLGQASVQIASSVKSLRRLRFASICRHVGETGIDAIPIISLIAFLISVVLAYQGAEQLRPLGAEQYTVNLVGISVLREMAVLLTAIMVAGRSGSAFAAEIGVMKVREEVDALRVMGLNPFEILIMPRLLGLTVSLPLLTFIAMIMGLFGGAMISMMLLGIPMEQFLERLRHAAHGHDMFVGLIKAPVFAFLIAIVGCMHGMKVEGSAESVGKHTTAAVVQSIFLVLAVDAAFSVLFQKMGI